RDATVTGVQTCALPILFHTGPSTQVNPSAIFSSFASRGTSLSKRASRRTIVTGTDVGLLLGKATYDQSGSEAARAITNKRTGCRSEERRVGKGQGCEGT